MCSSSIHAGYLSVELTFVLSARRPRCCQQSLNLCCCDSDIFVNPAWSVILTHRHFEVALLPPWPLSYALPRPAMCLLFAPVLFVLFLFRFRFIIVKRRFLYRWAQMSGFPPPLFLTCTTRPSRASCLPLSSQLSFSCFDRLSHITTVGLQWGNQPYYRPAKG